MRIMDTLFAHMCVQVFMQCINPFCGVSSKNIDLYLFWYLLTNLYTSPRHHTSTNTSVPTGICEPRWLRLEHWILNYVEFKYQTIFQNVTIFQWVSKCQESLLFGQQYFSLLFTSWKCLSAQCVESKSLTNLTIISTFRITVMYLVTSVCNIFLNTSTWLFNYFRIH